MFTIIFAELTAGSQATPAKTFSVGRSKKTQLGQTTVATEATEGLDQSDYLTASGAGDERAQRAAGSERTAQEFAPLVCSAPIFTTS